MDKTAIRNFAIGARKILMKSAITEAGFYGITKDGCKDPVQKGNDFEVYETVAGTENRIFGDDIKRRANLVQAIKTLGFEQVIEETAYTWFNRIIAIRFMELNNYLPTRVRVLSSETGSGTPDIITQADTVELNLTSDELEKIQNAKRENRYDDAFRMLFIKQCNELNAILPGLFEKTDDYMELLLKITYTGDGVIRMLVDSIPEDNFNVETEGQVEIIGWMYQYYNTELKDDTFAKLKKNVKITKERIPAATQLFTPDWIVRYMVENSLGRVWIEHLRAVNPSVDEKAKAEEFDWKYYLLEAEQEDDVQTQLVEIRKSYKDLTPQDITCIDPCMGSGHILVYMFDVLMDIYRSEGFSEREAVFDILEKNIRGLDIDRRAYQLSYFALMMKARGYNRIFFRGHEDINGNRVQAVPRVYAIDESNSVDREQLKYYGAGLDDLSKNNAINQMNGLLDSLYDAKEYGSILSVENYNWELLRLFMDSIDDAGQGSLFGFMAYQSKPLLDKLINIGEVLSNTYDAVVTNPPYMNSSGMNSLVSKYVKKNYKNSKSDLYAVFIEVCRKMQKKNGFLSMITMQSWMFIGSFEQLRKKVLSESTITSLLQLGIKAFEEIGNDVVQTAAFCIRENSFLKYKGCYHQLTTHSREEKQIQFFDRSKQFYTNQSKFFLIEVTPIAYWMPDSLAEIFEKEKSLGQLADAKIGIQTGNNELFVRFWTEVSRKDIFYYHEPHDTSSDLKWFPYTKGGSYRKWYGNNELVVEWKNQGESIRKYNKLGNINDDFYYKPCVSWGLVSSAGLNFRYVNDYSHVIGNGGPMARVGNGTSDTNYYLLGLLNSCVTQYISEMLNPTINMSTGTVSNIPVILNDDAFSKVVGLVKECVDLCKEDYDEQEMSIDFKKHPMVGKNCSVKTSFELWKNECDKRFQRLKENEELINAIFIQEYGLENELSSKVDEKYVSVSKIDEYAAIRSLISYSVGCMFGRYSLDEDGLTFAGGDWCINDKTSFLPDADNIIPIVDEDYFEADIVGLFFKWIRKAFGEERFDENIHYIATVLEKKGNNDREVIRNYFIEDFYNDHCSTYSAFLAGKRPIYWLFDSGKNNGFKCLIYLHRYNPDTVGLVRSDYLTKAQSMIENALSNAEYAINTSPSAVDKAQATKKRDKYIKQLAEIRAYYPALSHIALQRIDLDLDDGVKANYEKFQNIEVSIEGEKKQKVNLLAKI